MPELDPSNRYEGHPCINCGSTERYISTKECCACSKTYCSKWRKDNREHVNQTARDYRQDDKGTAARIQRQIAAENEIEELRQFVDQETRKGSS